MLKTDVRARASAQALIGALLLGAIPAQAVVFDQEHMPEIFSEWSVAAMGPVGQEFVPTLAQLNLVELWIDHGLTGTEQPADLSVLVRQGSIDGTVLGQSGAVRVEDGLFASVRFDFAAVVSLTPGATYVLQVQVAPGGGNPLVCGSDGPDYPAGRAILLGNPVGSDLWFRTGATDEVADEMTTWGAIKALYRP